MGGVVTKIDQNNRAAISGEVTALRQNNANDFIAIEAAYHRNEYKSKFYYGAAGYTVSCGILYTIFKNTERIPKIYGGLGAIYVWNGAIYLAYLYSMKNSVTKVEKNLRQFYNVEKP